MNIVCVVVNIAVLGICICSVKGSLVVEERFDYGNTEGALVGLAGGTGFAGAWSNDIGMGTFNYSPAGLTFGMLATTGGSAQIVSATASSPSKAQASRQMNLVSDLTGSVYGSYLFSIPYMNNAVAHNSLAILFGNVDATTTGSGGSPDNFAQIDVSGLYYGGGGRGNVRLINHGGSANASGILINSNTTYLALWEADGIVASGSGAETLAMWILTANQFACFKTNGLSKAALNAAALGTNATSILQRAAVSGSYTATFLKNGYLNLFGTFAPSTALGVIFDEVRVGTVSLDEVTPTGPSIPQIVTQPSSVSAYVGDSLNVNIGASGYPVPCYQWRAGPLGSHNFTNLVNRGTISGATSATLILSNASIANTADYVVVVTNIVGAVTSAPATVTITSHVFSSPQIDQQPRSQAAYVGFPVHLSVVAAGFPDPSYQWLAGGIGSGIYTNLVSLGQFSGTSSSNLAIGNISFGNAADYVVVVSNSMGVVTSAPATLSVAYPIYSTNSIPSWGLGPFVRPDGVNPVIMSNTSSTFLDPILNDPVYWEYKHTFNPAAVVKDGKINILYRAEDDSGTGIGSFTPRLGLAISADGLNFYKFPSPVFYPDNDEQKANEWNGGCEDPRVVETEDGNFVILYTQWNHSLARLGVATSTDLVHWVKHGSPWALYGTSSVNQNTKCKSAAILTRLVDGRLKAVKHLGQYWMYWGEGTISIATSDDLINWRPGPALLSPRSGKFDSNLVEGGPPAVLTDAGIVVFYNGKNANPGDTNLFPGTYSGGQALFDAKEPSKLIARMDRPFYQPLAPFEMTGQYSAGTTFIEGLVYFRNQWLLYYGCADSFVAVATCSRNDFGLTDPWPSNCYYQDFDGLNVAATNTIDGSQLLSTAIGSVAGVRDSFQRELQLTSSVSSNVTSAFILKDIAGGQPLYAFSARWNSEFYYTNLPDCGLSFNLSKVSGAEILNLPVEKGYGSGLSVSVENDKNGERGFFVRLGTNIVAYQVFDPDIQWGKGNFHRNYFTVDWNFTNGVTLRLNETTIFKNVPTLGLTPTSDMRFSWAARNGANPMEIRLDNISVFAGANLNAIALNDEIASSGNTVGNFATNAFDGNWSTQWQLASNNGWIQSVSTHKSPTVTAYEIVSGNSNWSADPKSWTLQGSNDGTNWVVVDTENGEGWQNADGYMRMTARNFLIDHPAPFNSYRLNIITNQGDINTQVSEIVLYKSDRITAPIPIINSAKVQEECLIIQGTGGTLGGNFSVVCSTNITVPLNQWSVVLNSQCDNFGNFIFTNTTFKKASAVFYKIKIP